MSKDYLAMSDEELLAAPEPEVQEEVVEEDPATQAVDVSDDAPVEEPEQEEKTDQDEEQDPPSTEEENTEGEAETAGSAPAEKPASEASTDKQETKQAEEKPAEIDYKAEYERLLAPIKANGKEVQIKSIDDAIALAQMGMGYAKKMAALKPNMKLLKLLENNGLLSEEKIGFLIDLDKKNPGAINKLVKDSGIDPMDLSAENASTYKQTAYAVDDREIELDTVLDDIKDSSTYTRTLDVVGNKWDAASKRVVADSPQLVKVINTHIENGIYDLIAKEVDRERTFGRLNGLSDIEAYRQIGDRLNASGAFNHLVSQTNAPTQQAQKVIAAPKVDDSKLIEKKRAASSTKATPVTNKTADFNPLALSDDEFNKIAESQYI